MALLKIWEVSRGIMRLLAIQFVCWLGWFSTFALAQFEGVTGSVHFPALGVTCVANLAVFVTTVIRGRLDLEMGARDVLEILLSPKLKRIKHEYGLTTCNEGGGDLPTASAEPVPQTASREESDVHAASTRGTENASTEGNVNTSASTERGGLQTIHIQAAAAQAEEEAILFARKEGLKSAAVIMLSNDTANWSMKQFMKSNAYVVQSIVLPFLPLKHALSDTKVKRELTPGFIIRSYKCTCSTCHCIVFWTMEEITNMLATRMPATLKLLSHSLCLLPCSTCLRKGCHECNRENLLRAESEADEGQPMRQRVVSNILDNIRAGDIPAGKPIGFCIPMNDARGDDWTKLLLKSLRSKDAAGRGVTNMAAEALEGYLGGGRGSKEGSVEYDIFSFVVPRLTEVLINLVLTFWFKVDGFSSALVARRTVRDYLVDSKSSGFAANAFLTEAVVKSNGDNTQVCQVLTFRGRDWLCFITFISVGCFNVICALGWSLLISFEGGPDTSQPDISQPPSLPRVAVIIAATGSPMAVLAAMMVAELWTSYDIDSVLWVVKFFLVWFPDITVPRFVVRLLHFPLKTGRWFVRVLLKTLHRMTVPQFVVRVLDFLLMTRGWFVRVSVWLLKTLHCMTVPQFVVGPLDFLLMTGGRFGKVYVFVSLIIHSVVISPVLFPVCIILATLGHRQEHPYAYPLIAIGAFFEMACFVSWSALAGVWGRKGFGRWLYGALQILIWVKWATGSYFLNHENSSEFFGRIPNRGMLILYSSAFWLNAVLAGVRCKWEAWPWKHNHLF